MHHLSSYIILPVLNRRERLHCILSLHKIFFQFLCNVQEREQEFYINFIHVSHFSSRIQNICVLFYMRMLFRQKSFLFSVIIQVLHIIFGCFFAFISLRYSNIAKYTPSIIIISIIPFVPFSQQTVCSCFTLLLSNLLPPL